MMEEIKEMLKGKASLEREYLELVNISGEMNLSAEIHDRLIMANIAHSLSVIADALADRNTEQTDEPQTDICDECIFVKGSGWCNNCNGKPKGLDALPKKDEPQPTTDCSQTDCEITDCEYHSYCKRRGQTDCAWKKGE